MGEQDLKVKDITITHLFSGK